MIIPETIVFNGRGYAYMTTDQLREAGVPEDVIATAVAGVKAKMARTETRARITSQAGDIPSLLGTTSDAAALGLIAVLQLVVVLAENGSPEIKAALAASPIPMPIAKAKAFLTDIKTGKIKVPALLKGVDAVYAEVATRSTATATAMTAPKA